MRERKYRVFHKDSKSMEHGFDLVSISQYLNKFTDEYIQKNIVVMDWTGLNDKHGIEIFEGDIVKNENNMGIIEFADDIALYEVRIHPIGSQGLYGFTMGGIEIIGNFYENPELLNNHPS